MQHLSLARWFLWRVSNLVTNIFSRNWNALQVISVGIIEAGNCLNVIPETVKFGGTLRSMTTEGLSYLQQRIREVVEMQAAVHRCTTTVDFMEDEMRPYPATVNDESIYEHVKEVGESMLGDLNVQLVPMVMGAEDFSFYAQKMRAAFFMIGAKPEVEKEGNKLHSPYLFLNEEVLPVGAALHAAVAISYLNNLQIATG